jgi:hypothetical protein
MRDERAGRSRVAVLALRAVQISACDRAGAKNEDERDR